MAYPKFVTQKVKSFYEDRKAQRRQLLEEKLQAVYKALPRVEEIDREIQRLGLQLAKAVLEKGQSEEAFVNMRDKTLALNMEKCEVLVSAGYPSDYLQPQYDCSICQDEGFVDGRMCACFAQKLREEAYLVSNLPLVMDKQSFDTFRLDYYPEQEQGVSPRVVMEVIRDECRNYAAVFSENDENLLLYGGTGLGKTFLSSCIAKEVLGQGYSVFYQPSYKIFSIFEENKFGNDNKELLKVQIEYIYQTDLLIIDDLGTEMVTAYTAEVLFDLLNTRLVNQKKTIINTNLGLAELETIYSPRITSRIIGSYTQLKFYGEDIRRMDCGV